MATRPAARSAHATRRELLLETLALRHQLCVLAHSNRRFRPVDRLFWLFLRWPWPRWRDALVLIKPATVDRWHREGIRQCWRRRSRRPGRPRIDSTCRDLIRRMAAENCLWGAPRIHGELLKLGIMVSERTVSRYLHGRPITQSQTWRTFFANHFGGQTLKAARGCQAQSVRSASSRRVQQIRCQCRKRRGGRFMSSVAIVSVESFMSTSGQLDRVFEPYTLRCADGRGRQLTQESHA
jgi:homeodomain-containing protein